MMISGSLLSQTSKKSSGIKPSGFQQKTTIIISEKDRTYYNLDPAQPAVIKVIGPGKLTVITRGQFKPGEVEKISYSLLYTVDGGIQKTKTFSDVLRSAKAKYADVKTGVPGQSEEFTLDLGRGNHSIEFKLKDGKIPVACRFTFTPVKEKKKTWVAFSPTKPFEPVEIISKEASTTYYRFSMEKPLKVVINGPSEVRVLSRIENHYQMKGRIHYRLQVKENNQVINTYQLSSTHSENAVYENDKSLVPGKACEFVINVPKGSHAYEIVPMDKDKSTVLGRLLIPEKDVKLEK
jgi:hypothetical protein